LLKIVDYGKVNRMNKPTNKLFIDLEGKTFGRLLVMSYAGTKRPDRVKNKEHQWSCLCKCGNSTIVRGGALKTGKTQSCGCLHKEATSNARWIELKGRKFGKWSVIDYDRDKCKQAYWSCRCECGRIKSVAGGSLRSGKSSSCNTGPCSGMFKHGMTDKPGYKAHYHQDPIRKIKHNISVSIRDTIKLNGDIKKSKTFQSLSYTPLELKTHIESLWEPWMNWENHGGKSNNPELSWHIDHIIPHSSFPYTSLEDPLFQECWALSNLRPLEKLANLRKGKS
jgi:hypothetical protein